MPVKEILDGRHSDQHLSSTVSQASVNSQSVSRQEQQPLHSNISTLDTNHLDLVIGERVTRQEFDIFTPVNLNCRAFWLPLIPYQLSHTITSRPSRCATGSRPSTRIASTQRPNGWPTRAPFIQGIRMENASSIPRRAKSLPSSATAYARSARRRSNM